MSICCWMRTFTEEELALIKPMNSMHNTTTSLPQQLLVTQARSNKHTLTSLRQDLRHRYRNSRRKIGFAFRFYFTAFRKCWQTFQFRVFKLIFTVNAVLSLVACARGYKSLPVGSIHTRAEAQAKNSIFLFSPKLRARCTKFSKAEVLQAFKCCAAGNS